ncbi:ATPase [Aureococcus anophagefferens]|nr:ATPase [Aureococcus anophagefferens]
MWRSVDDAIIFAPRARRASAAARRRVRGACGAFCVRDPGDAPPDYVLECVCHGGFDGAAVVSFLLHVPRAVLALTRAPSEFVFEVSVQLAAGAFLGALYPHFEFGDSQQVAFILQLSLGGTIALSSARTFGTTRQALWRELAPNLGGMGLGATPMLAATRLVELPRSRC